MNAVMDSSAALSMDPLSIAHPMATAKGIIGEHVDAMKMFLDDYAKKYDDVFFKLGFSDEFDYPPAPNVTLKSRKPIKLVYKFPSSQERYINGMQQYVSELEFFAMQQALDDDEYIILAGERQVLWMKGEPQSTGKYYVGSVPSDILLWIVTNKGRFIGCADTPAMPAGWGSGWVPPAVQAPELPYVLPAIFIRAVKALHEQDLKQLEALSYEYRTKLIRVREYLRSDKKVAIDRMIGELEELRADKKKLSELLSMDSAKVAELVHELARKDQSVKELQVLKEAHELQIAQLRQDNAGMSAGLASLSDWHRRELARLQAENESLKAALRDGGLKAGTTGEEAITPDETSRTNAFAQVSNTPEQLEI